MRNIVQKSSKKVLLKAFWTIFQILKTILSWKEGKKVYLCSTKTKRYHEQYEKNGSSSHHGSTGVY